MRLAAAQSSRGTGVTGLDRGWGGVRYYTRL